MTRLSFEWARWTESPGWSALLLAVLLAFFVLSLAIYRQDAARQTRAARGILFLLRTACWLMLAALIFEPRLRVEEEIERVSHVAVGFDTSLSMTLPVRDQESATSTTSAPPVVPSRLDAAREQTLAPNWWEKLNERHELSLYRMAGGAERLARIERKRLGPAKEKTIEPLVASLRAEGAESRLGDALLTLVRDSEDRPTAGIVLFTDGRSTGGESLEVVAGRAQQAGLPLFPVGLGSTTPPFNLRVSDVRVPSRAFRGDEVRGTVLVQGIGKKGTTASVEIVLRSRSGDGTSTMLEVQDVLFPPDESPVSVSFPFSPETLGSFEIVCQIANQAGEVRTDDNQGRAPIDVVDQKTKVLLLAGGPTREYRFIRNLLFRDPTMELAVHLQSARASSSQEGKETLSAFPKSKDELFKYDVLVAIDPNWELLPPESLALVEEWVSRQAAGAILVAGPIHTPALARADALALIQALYPVNLKEVFHSDFAAGQYREPWKVEFTAEGSRTSYLRLADDAAGSEDRWARFPGFYWCYPATSLKPAASLLATYTDPRAAVGSSSPPLMAMQFVGAGRVFYLGSGEIWRIRADDESSYDRFWIRLIREMSQSRLLRGSSRATLLIDGDRFPAGATIPVRVQLLGPDYRPQSAGVVPISLTAPDGKATSIDLSPVASQPGFFHASIPLTTPGAYRLQMLVPESTDIVERSLVAELPEQEFVEPTLAEAELRRLADQTGGAYLTLNELPTLPERLKDRSERTLEPRPPVPLWDNVWVLLAFVLTASTEWLLRKWLNLA